MGSGGVIYKIENLVNGKVYIGQTIQGFEKRMRSHLYELQRNNHKNEYLQNAWNKYGEINFSFSVVEECDVEILDEREINLILQYKNVVGVYNLDSGGNKNKVRSEATLIKMSKATKILWLDDEFREKKQKKIVCINTGEVFESGMEASRKMGLAIKNMYSVCSGNRDSVIAGDGNRYQFAHYEEGKKYALKPLKSSNIPRKVILVNTCESFNSIREASEKTAVQESKIGACCRGERATAGEMPNKDRMVWVYAEDYNKEETYSFERRQSRGKNPNARKVICLTTGKVFECMQDAGEYYGIKYPSKISLACRGKRKHVGKLPDGTQLKWAYYGCQ